MGACHSKKKENMNTIVSHSSWKRVGGVIELTKVQLVT